MARIKTDQAVRLMMRLRDVAAQSDEARALAAFAGELLLARAGGGRGLGSHVDAQLEELARRLG